MIDKTVLSEMFKDTEIFRILFENHGSFPMHFFVSVYDNKSQ